MRQTMQRFFKEADGNVLMLTGLLFFILLGAGGMGVDLGRQQLVRIKLQQASDAAALAGALAPDGTDREAVARRYFAMNFPSEYMGVQRPTPRVTVGAQVHVSADATMDTFFVRHIGTESMSSSGSSTVGVDEAVTPQSYDMILVVDNSGSMDTADAGNQYIREPDAASKAQARTFGQTKCRNAIWNPSDCFTWTYGLTGMTRLNALRYSAGILIDQLLGDPKAQSQIGFASFAHELYAHVPPTTNRTSAMQAIDYMFAWGGTNSTLGLDSAGRLLSQYGVDGHVKVVVLLTDGENTSAGTLIPRAGSVTGLGDTSGCDGFNLCRPANTQSLAQCTAMKNRDILIYTIAFGKSIDAGPNAAVVKNFLSNCASGTAGSNENQYFFVAPDGASLQAAFSAILTSVKKVRIVE